MPKASDCTPWSIVRILAEPQQPLAVISPEDAKKPQTHVRTVRWDGSIADIPRTMKVEVVRKPGQLSIWYLQKLLGYHEDVKLAYLIQQAGVALTQPQIEAMKIVIRRYLLEDFK